MTQQTTTNKPAETIRDGAFKATIWKNLGEKGAFFSTTITRLYTDEHGNYHESTRFSGADLLKVSRLAGKAYDRELELRAAESKPDNA